MKIVSRYALIYSAYCSVQSLLPLICSLLFDSSLPLHLQTNLETICSFPDLMFQIARPSLRCAFLQTLRPLIACAKIIQ
jgi:hypothetical protein